MSLTISPQRCPQNHRCPMIQACPVNAIQQDGYGLPTIDIDLCTNCGKCSRICPLGAVVEMNN